MVWRRAEGTPPALPVTDLIEQGAPAFETAIPILSQLLKAELAEREVRSIAYHMKAARFPAYKDLTGFDFAASEVNVRIPTDPVGSFDNIRSVVPGYPVT